MPGTNFPTASSLGIIADGVTDQSTSITSYLNSYGGIILDVGPLPVLINGTVNPSNPKVIQFLSGSYFTGSGSLSNVIIDAGMRQLCFDRTLTISPAVLPGVTGVANKYFSALWFYSSTVDGTNYQPAFQKALDTVVANEASVKSVFLPAGNYMINSPLMIYQWDGSKYIQACVNLIGESSFWENSSSGTIITCNYKNTFALGIQDGKGCKIKNIKFTGGFTPPYTASTPYNFYNCAFSAFTDGVSRDQPFSPYAAIVVDPFYATVPSDGGYPGMTSWYRGSSGTGGTTGTELEDIFITNFVVGFISSPNGVTSNAELTTIEKIQFENCKLCVANCQPQEKLNVMKHAACWGGTHTFFASSFYGSGAPGNWYIEGVNIAGAVNTLVYRNSGGYFPLYMKNVYAESLGQIGYWNGTMSDCIEDSLLDFAAPAVTGAMVAWLATGQLVFKNCSLRYYGTNYRTAFSGIFKFVNCVFEDIPYVFSDQSIVGNLAGIGNTVFEDCWAAGLRLGRSKDVFALAAGASFNYCYGNYRLLASDYFYTGKESWMQVNYHDPICRLYVNPAGTQSSIVVTQSGTLNTAVVTPASSADLIRLKLNCMVTINNQYVLGLITSIGASTYTVSYVPSSITSGSYNINILYNLYVLGFMGSISNGSQYINSVVADRGTISNVISNGGCVKIMGFYDYGGYEQGALMISYSGGIITMDRPASGTGSNLYFSNANVLKSTFVRGTNAMLNFEVLQKGGQWGDSNPANGGNRIFIITATGYYSGTPQATWTELT